MIKAILFDFFGVMRTDEYHNWLASHGLGRDETRGTARKLDLGDMSLDQFFEALSELSGVPADQVRQEFSANAGLNKPLISLIIRLKKKYKVAILSNANSAYLKDILKKSAIEKLFNEVIASSDLGCIKPSKEIFAYSLQKLGIQPEEALFIDDNPSFISAAKALGIKGIHYQDFPTLKNELISLDIISS